MSIVVRRALIKKQGNVLFTALLINTVYTMFNCSIAITNTDQFYNDIMTNENNNS